MQKGYTKEIVEQNIEDLIESGENELVAIATAVSTARGQYKKDYPETSIFPKHLAPGAVIDTYIKGVENIGQEE